MAYKSKLYGEQLETAILAVIEKLDGEHLAEATTETSGLMSAEDKKKLASALAGIVSLGTKTDDITNTLQKIEEVIGSIRSGLQGKVNKTTTINGKAINDGVVLDGGDIKIGTQTLVDIINNATKELNGKVPATRTVNGKELTKNIEIYLQNLRDLYSGKYLPGLLDEKANAADVKKSLTGKANLNSQGALATGEEQRLVVDFVNIDGKHIEVNIPGVYYNGTTKHIETYKRYGEGIMSVVLLEFSEEPSANVVYCDKAENKLYRWNGTAMVQVGGGGGSVDAYTKAESDRLLAGKVPTLRTINGKPLSQDVTLTGDNIRVSEDDARPMSNAVPLLNNAYKLLLANTAPVVVHFYDAFSTAVAGANINTETNMYEIWLYKHTTGNGGTSVPPRLIKVWEEELSTDVIYCDEYDNSLMRYDAANNEWVILNDGSGIEIVQDTGEAIDKVMSQKAVSDLIGDVESVLRTINGE